MTDEQFMLFAVGVKVNYYDYGAEKLMTPRCARAITLLAKITKESSNVFGGPPPITPPLRGTITHREREGNSSGRENTAMDIEIRDMLDDIGKIGAWDDVRAKLKAKFSEMSDTIEELEDELAIEHSENAAKAEEAIRAIKQFCSDCPKNSRFPTCLLCSLHEYKNRKLF